jgi:hypothetical protein
MLAKITLIAPISYGQPLALTAKSNYCQPRSLLIADLKDSIASNVMLGIRGIL